MGKIRVKTFGDEEQEKKDAEKAKARAEAKKAAAKKAAGATDEDAAKSATEKTEEASAKKTSQKYLKQTGKKQKHSKQYLAVASHVDKNKKYTLEQALELLPKVTHAKFDETVELHINTHEKGVSGNFVLPHGTGKQTRVVIANYSQDPQHVDDLLKKIEAGQIEFDVLIATPDTMPKLARVARVLGPRGLMPNPKNGTVTPKPEEVAKNYAGGQMNFKTEAKFPIIHLAVGKVSFGDKKLNENIKIAVTAVKIKNIKTLTLKSTMSPAIKLDTASLA